MSEVLPMVRKLPPDKIAQIAHLGHPKRNELEDRRALVRCIASSPVHIQWLRDHIGQILVREARQLEALGDPEGGEHLRRRAAAHVRGELPLW